MRYMGAILYIYTTCSRTRESARKSLTRGDATHLVRWEFRSRCVIDTSIFFRSGVGAVFDQRPHVQQVKWQEHISRI